MTHITSYVPVKDYVRAFLVQCVSPFLNTNWWDSGANCGNVCGLSMPMNPNTVASRTKFSSRVPRIWKLLDLIFSGSRKAPRWSAC